MEQFLSELVITSIVKKVIRPITRHLGYVICTTKQLTHMREKMEDLKNKSIDVKKHKDANTVNGKEVPNGVESWLTEVENVNKIVENVNKKAENVNKKPENVNKKAEKINKKAENANKKAENVNKKAENVEKKDESISTGDQGIGCLNIIIMRYESGRKASKATETIEKLITQNSKFDWTDIQKPSGRVDPDPASSAATMSAVPPLDDLFKSREILFNDTLKLLQQDHNNSQVIALCGMGGVGKTTLMEQLKQVAYDKKMFNFIVKVVIGRDPNMSSIQNDIAVSIGGEKLPGEILATRADSLCEKFKEILKDGKTKILVILDDVWEKIDIKNIGLKNPLPEGVKLLLTSRYSNICREIAAGSIFQEVRVDVMKEEEAQNFFSQITGVSQHVDHDKYEIGCKIIKKCGRLPLAIKLIATTLKSQQMCVWNTTLIRLNKNKIDDNVQEVIKISYEYIRKEEDKELFLLCGLFPEDTDIPIEFLTRYAWGLRLFKDDASTLRDARDMTKTCVENLLDANLLIRGRDDLGGCVKMHDLVLLFVLGEVSRGNHSCFINHGDISKWDGVDQMSESYKRISLTCMGMSEFPQHFICPNVNLIQLMHGDPSLKFPKDFYENMEKLQVISYLNMQSPLVFPRSLQCSTNLKTLILESCKLIFDCSFVGDLVNLEVLSFAYCNINKLPSAIGNLRKLKLLDLTGCVDLRIDDGVFNNLEKLEELYMSLLEEPLLKRRTSVRFTDGNFEDLKKLLSLELCALEVEFVEKNTQLTNLSFKKLKKFQISIGCRLGREARIPNTLKLVTDSSRELLDCEITELFEKTEKLHLQVTDMISLEDYSFYNLRDLEVSDCEKLKRLFPYSVACSLRKLERLTVSSCSVLEAVVDNNDGSEIKGEVKFEKLKYLCLKRLPKLLSFIDNVVELPQLTELELDGLPNFTSIYPADNSSLQQPLFNRQVKVSKLESVKIRSMEKLKQVWGCGIASQEEVMNIDNISMLKEIEVVECDGLMNLFPTNPMRLLNHLETIKVEKCGSIEEIFNIDLECVDTDEQLNITSSSLRSIEVFYSKNFREVWRIKGGENYKSSSSSLLIHEFEKIRISDCRKFRNVFTPTTSDAAKFDIIIISMGSVVQSDTEKDDNINSSVVFPSSNLLLHSFHNFHELKLERCEGVEVVFEIESSSPLLPNLQRLELRSMDNMSHVWKCNNNWNIQSSSFNNLTSISLYNCKRIKYLFSPLMAKLLSNLKEIFIIECDGMEEVVSNRDNDEGILMTTSTALFPHLQSLHLKRLQNLERFVGGGETTSGLRDQVSHNSEDVCWSLCQFPGEIVIYDCKSLVEVFETQGINNNEHYSTGGGGITTTSVVSPDIPRLENINVPSKLFSLKKLEIIYCGLLKHVFTFSTLKSLGQLEELKIGLCNAMEVVVVVKKENEEQAKDVEFPHLKSLELLDLPNLKGFFLGMNIEFKWPLLERVKIWKCPQMKVFTNGPSTTPELKYIHTNLGRKYSLDHEVGLNNIHVTTHLHQTVLPSSECTNSLSASSTAWLEGLSCSFNNLVEIDMERDGEVQEIIIPSNKLLQLQQLERIRVYRCLMVKEVFEVEAMEGGTNSDSQIAVEIPNLRQVELNGVYNLKYIWKSNHHHVLVFPNLTTLSIHGCCKLKHVFTSSMVGSLQQLQDLHISDCDSLTVIVEEEEVECDVIVKQITFPCLKSIKLQDLQSLKGFCLGNHDFSCPSLHTLEIKECPEITVFSKGNVGTPALDVTCTYDGNLYVRDHEDINSLIKTRKHEGFHF